MSTVTPPILELVAKIQMPPCDYIIALVEPSFESQPVFSCMPPGLDQAERTAFAISLLCKDASEITPNYLKTVATLCIFHALRVKLHVVGVAEALERGARDILLRDQYYHEVLYHGTLLYQMNLPVMDGAWQYLPWTK